MNLLHLARRFFTSIRPVSMNAADEAWLLSLLSPAEVELYRAQPLQDRLHAVACALAVRELGDDISVASALHDVGKSEARLGTMARVGATVVGAVVPVRVLDGWLGSPGVRCAIATYKRHDVRGADALARAGSSELTVAWAREHHRRPSEWTLDTDAGRALLAADHGQQLGP